MAQTCDICSKFIQEVDLGNGLELLVPVKLPKALCVLVAV
jgi:hypothetical protein